MTTAKNPGGGGGGGGGACLLWGNFSRWGGHEQIFGRWGRLSPHFPL